MRPDGHKFDCYANAEPGEPMFVLLARDACAPAAVEKWIEYREALVTLGIKPEQDRAMLQEARDCANAMRAWRSANRPPLKIESVGSDDAGNTRSSFG